LGEVVIEMKGVHISTSKPRAHPAADQRQRKSDPALASWKICNKLKPPFHCAKAGMPSLRPQRARHPRSLASRRHEVDGKSVDNQLEEISPSTSMCSPPNTDGAGRPRAVASAVSEFMAKVRTSGR
jgi:hypothetical protein